MAGATARGPGPGDVARMGTHMRSVRGQDPDALVLRLAARQHGVVTRAQLASAGITKSMLQGRVRRGRLVKVHPGVFCVGGSARTLEQRCFAATAWGGAGTVVSHRTAARLWRMIPETPEAVEISSARKRTRCPQTIRVRLAADLTARERGTLRRVPVTSPVRTLIDLASVAAPRDVEKTLHHAIAEGIVTTRALRERVADSAGRGRRGPALVRELLRDSHRHASSPLERAVAEALRCPELPPFRREHPVYAGGRVFYLDFAWPHFGVAVEADGRRWHSDPRSFEHDRERQNRLAAAGWAILRVTQQQVRTNPEVVRGQVLALLRARG